MNDSLSKKLTDQATDLQSDLAELQRRISELEMANATLHQAQQLYQAGLDAGLCNLILVRCILDDAQTLVDLEIQDVNQNFSNLVGISALDLRGRVFSSLYPQLFDHPDFRYIRQVARTGERKQLRAHVVELDSFFELAISRPAPGMLYLALADITSYMRNETELTRRLAVMEQATETMVVTELDGRILYANPFAAQSTGYSLDELKGQNPRLLKSDQQPASFYRQLWQTIQSGKTWRGRFINRRKDGSLYHEDATIFPITDAAGQIINYAAVKRDVTEQVAAERERERLLQASQEEAQRTEQILNSVPLGICLLDSKQILLSANPLGQEYLAILGPTQLGDRLSALGDQLITDLLMAPSKGLNHHLHLHHRIFEVNSRPVHRSFQVEGWVVIIDEITQKQEQQHRAEEQSRLAAVGQLAAGMAHDFNNIMSVITLYSQFLAKAPDMPVRARQQLITMHTQAQRATDLIQQILDFSRQADLERHPLQLAPGIKELSKLLQRTLPENISVHFRYDEQAANTGAYTISADPTRIQQAIMNLAINARDAMLEGGELIFDLSRFELNPADPLPQPNMLPGAWICLAVSDTGTGIPDHVLPRIYEPFFSTKPKGKGSGLGLAQVHGIVAQHEGFVSVKTAPGQGTTFLLYLPALADETTQVSAPELSLALTSGTGQTILLVEDNESARVALAEGLSMLNYTTLEAENGREALVVLDQNRDKIDLILSDVVMPVMGGLEFFAALKARGETIPVLFLTGHQMDAELDKLQAEGLAGWMVKPPRLEVLTETIANALKKTDQPSL